MPKFKCGHEAAGYNAMAYSYKKKGKRHKGTRCRECYNLARKKVAQRLRTKDRELQGDILEFTDEQGNKFKADGYKLRMVFLQWWLYLYDGDKDTGMAFGPYNYKQALRKAEIFNLKDVERT